MTSTEDVWEREKSLSREWNSYLEDLARCKGIELVSRNLGFGDIRSVLKALKFTESILSDACLQEISHTNRWKNLVKFLKISNSTEECMFVEDRMDQQIKRQVEIFHGNDPELSSKLAKGLLLSCILQIIPNSVPWNSDVMQVLRDVDAIFTLLMLSESGCSLNFNPLVLPYNKIESIVSAFKLDLFPGETCWSPYVEGDFMFRLLCEGFIPIAIKIEWIMDGKVILMPKMHNYRCCIKPLEIVMTKKGKRCAKDMNVTLNCAFNEVLNGIVEQHGENWLYPEIRREFERIYYAPESVGATSGSLNSVEVWKDGVLVAGEIGFVVGSAYTSISGFHKLPSSGTFQMYALAAILHFQSFELWDLGMILPYKLTMGAKTVGRREFLEVFYEARSTERILEIPAEFASPTDTLDLIQAFCKEQNIRKNEGSA
ncbi:leucyl/phenylalanyl-tRNA--protein transferase, putative [Theileria equi strain WA]|uniref:Leucyl/phenylalanyl-tRNA--protein transferase, putative n=1 Tax=Theileria equi strain WA TaxID=1537102 RepID=L0AXF1_THEEQ|nr:leucyl/phenylalanyl-tRNA--protein transferase, putative [Theileria equi strain WA]AFZ79584.1 leucyl/phenylalanyl-tRNA--protein transferase, putative [Theileria equi strain WA]|eukprot:XP_004829250.1 leucyl/phenylalanyl-tRNA--protein transferase, putative [Theileria equi strain WA]